MSSEEIRTWYRSRCDRDVATVAVEDQWDELTTGTLE